MYETLFTDTLQNSYVKYTRAQYRLKKVEQHPYSISMFQIRAARYK